jgi:hypothetical protein
LRAAATLAREAGSDGLEVICGVNRERITPQAPPHRACSSATANGAEAGS